MLPLDLPRARIWRLRLFGVLHAYPFVGLWMAYSVGLVVMRRFPSPLVLGALELLALALSIAIPLLVVRRRMPRDARVTWNADEVVEHDGDSVRTAIACADARVRDEGGVVQITDAQGRAITLAREGRTPRWLSRRKATTPDPTPLLDALADAPEGPPIRPDARDARRPVVAPILSMVTAVGGMTAAMTVYVSGWPLMTPLVLALTLALMQLLAALAPGHELLALAAAERALEGAETVKLEPSTDTLGDVVVTREDGSFLRVALPAATIADARIAQRGGALRIVLPRGGWAPASSRAKVGAAPLAVSAAETEQASIERSDVRIGAAIELALRGVAVLYWTWLSLPRVG